jgi:hypothetical protein
VLADAIVVIHLGLMLFITAGLPLIYIGAERRWEWVRHRRWRALHVTAIALVAAESLMGIVCPLTLWEDALRGQQSHEGLIERWVDRVLFYDFPTWMFTVAYTAFAALVVVTWFVVPPAKRKRANRQ